MTSNRYCRIGVASYNVTESLSQLSMSIYLCSIYPLSIYPLSIYPLSIQMITRF